MMAATFLALSLLWLFSSLCAATRIRRAGPLSFAIMMTGWLVGDHPVGHFVAQAAVTAVLIAGGALDTPVGWIALAATVTAWLGLAYAWTVARRADASAKSALAHGLGVNYPSAVSPARTESMAADPAPTRMRLNGKFRLDGVDSVFDLPYGDHPKRNLLDIHRPTGGCEGAPVLIQVHGGGWVIGHKQQQGLPLMLRLARRGWVCVSINYRLAPKHRMPDQIIDLKRAIAWVRSNIANHGGDPSTIVITGGSAGGHLVSLAALTPGLAAFQPGFEEADTSVAACVPFYPPTDFTDRNHIRGKFSSMKPFLARMVMPEPQSVDPELWHAVSPINHVNPDAPPFFVIQGENDVLVWREETQAFVGRLREVSTHPVVHWQVPGAQHAFDTFPAHRTTAAVNAVEMFLSWVVSTAVSTPGPQPRPITNGD